MRSGRVLLNLLMFSFVSLIITIVIYFVNFLLFSSARYISPTDAFFIEGLLFLLVGCLLLLGRGGINLWSQKAAILSALAEAMYKKDTVGPHEMYKRDKWKPEGFTRLALILIITGVIMLLVYFLIL